MITRTQVKHRLTDIGDSLRDKSAIIGGILVSGTLYTLDAKFLIIDGLANITNGLGEAKTYLASALSNGTQPFVGLVSGVFNTSVSSLGLSPKELAQETVTAITGGSASSAAGNTLLKILPGIGKYNTGTDMVLAGVMAAVVITGGTYIYFREKRKS